MKTKRSSVILWNGIWAVTALSCLFLMLHSIASSSNFQLADVVDWFRDAFSTTEEREGQKRNEVRHYVIFDSVEFGPWNVETGTRYFSSASRRIEKEWCYIRTENIEGRASEILELGKIDESGQQTSPRFDEESLRIFNLSAAGVRALTDTHCRFQSERKP